MKIEKASWWWIGLVALVLQIPYSMAPWGNGNYPTDICVYMRCAEWLQDGLVMYRDMFDHKGPLVYMIYEAVCLLGTTGVWLLDLLILYLSMLILYRMARLFTDERNSLIITTLLGGLAQLPFTDEGSPEWLVMPACIYSAYILAKRLKDHDYCSLTDIILFSASVAFCLFTKPNTCAGMIPIAGYIVWDLVRRFDIRVFGRYVLGVIIGLGVILLPVAAWIAQQGNLQEFIDAYWIFNTEAYAPMTRMKMIMGKVFVTLVCLPGFYAFGVYAWSAKKRPWELAFMTVLFFFTVLLNAYLKNGYPHYVAPCMAVFGLVLVLAWPYIQVRKALYGFTIGFLVLVGIGTFGARAYLRLTPFDTTKDNETALFINTHTDADDYVMVCDIDDRSRWSSMSPSYSFVYRLWLHLNAKPASPYFYLPPSITDAMRAKSWELQTARMPKYIVCTDEHEEAYLQLGYTRIQDIKNDYYILQRP